jgi:hypothetical protein
MSSLSDFIVEEFPGVVTPVTHQYAGDVQKKHISLADKRHKFRGGPAGLRLLKNMMRPSQRIDAADTLQ